MKGTRKLPRIMRTWKEFLHKIIANHSPFYLNKEFTKLNGDNPPACVWSDEWRHTFLGSKQKSLFAGGNNFPENSTELHEKSSVLEIFYDAMSRGSLTVTSSMKTIITDVISEKEIINDVVSEKSFMASSVKWLMTSSVKRIMDVVISKKSLMTSLSIPPAAMQRSTRNHWRKTEIKRMCSFLLFDMKIKEFDD